MKTGKAGRRRTPEALTRVRRNFKKWDRNSDGRVTESELWQAMRNPEVKGKDAAALAAVLMHQEHLHKSLDQKALPSLTKPRLKKLAADPKAKKYLQEDYENAQKRLKRSSKSVYTQKGYLRAEMIRQAFTNQCGFLSALYPVVRDDQEFLKDVIQTTDDGYLVDFPGVIPNIKVDPLTDSELILHSSALENGRWLTVMEKAWGQWQSGRVNGAMTEWTHPVDAVVAITQNDGLETHIPRSTKAQPGETPRFLKTSERTLAQGGTVIANVPGGKPKLKGLRDWHYYTVTGWDSENHIIHMRNPDKRSEPVNSKGKPRDGKRDGHFSLTLEEFMADFRWLARETPSTKKVGLSEPPALLHRPDE